WNATFISRVDEQASHGTYSAKLSYDGSLGAREIYLTHPLKNAVPGGTYKITVDVRGSLEKLVDSADDAVGLSYDPNNGVDGMKWSVGKVVAKDDEWQTIEATITLPAGSTKPVLRVGYYNVKGTVYVDNLTVTLLDIPEGYEPPEAFEPIEVELENGSFEHTTANGSQAKGWKPSDGGNNSAVTLITGGAYDGDISCKLTSTYGRHTYNDYKVKGLIPGATYKISYATKGSLTYNVEGAAEPATNMGLDILPYDYNDVWVEGAKIMGIGGIKVTDEWQIHEGEITLPQGCTRIVIRPGIANWVGSVYVDDFKLTLVEVPEGVDPTAPTEPVEDDEPKFDPEDSVDGIQMVYNPSFEILDTASGEAASYTYLIQAGDENSYITVNTDPEKSRTGNNSIHLFNDGPGALVAPYTAYRIPLTKGATYVISYWVKGEVTADVFPYTIMWFGTNADGDLATTVESETTKISADPARWQNVLVTFKAPADRDYVTIGAGFAWGTGDLYIDDLEMYLAEMPGGESVDGKQWMFNGDFELVTDGVTDGHTYTGNVSVETEEVYEGNNALKMTGSDDAYVTMPVRDLVSGSAYAVSFWYKGELTDGSISMTTDLYRENDVSDATDNYRGTINVGAVIPSDEWQQYTGVISIPSNAAYGEFKLGFTEGSGTIYVDDVQLLLISAPTLARMLPDQVYYYTGEYETGKAVTTFNESYHAANTIEIDYQLIDTDNGTVLAEQKNVPIVDDKAVFEFDMDLLTQKQYGYTVKAIIRNKGSELPRSILTDKVYVWDRPLALNENGEFLEGDFVDGEYVPNGEIFTPVIGFEVPGTCGRESGKLLQQGELLDKLLEGGINTILYYIPGGDEQTGFANAKKELDFLAEKGMKALILMYWGMEPSAAPNNVNRIPAAVEALKEHPAIYAWYTADEPFSHDKDGDRVRQQLIDSYKLIRAIDPVHPIYYTEDNAPRYAEADHYADIVSIDPYSGAAEDYETRVGDRSAQLVEETDNARPMNNILQAFTFAGSKPTDIQFRNMIYAAYLGGSRTLGYWCIRDRDVDAVIYERDLWPIITEFNDNEYDIIREQYADGQGEFVAQSRGDNAWYDIWEVDGEYYMIITNRTKKDTTAEVEFDGDITALELVTKYKVDGVVLTETEDGFTVELPASQGVMVKITAVADDDNDDEDDTNEFEPEGKPGKKPFDGVVIIIGAGEDKENVGTGGSSYKVLASLAGFAAVAAGALIVSDKKFRTK
ncbi:MAG: carbohydrate binding domain-containing protein, partial [Oscillospiraceae bacterium]|nr:carbohydrate binding domain-containing protein [Oscillospiraceae bacterium]